MTKNEFMKELEALLSDISADERIEALQYYDNYFEDAGPEREESIIIELGSPGKVAASIKADLNAGEQELNSRGYFTEKGYEDENLREPKFEIVGGNIAKEENDNSKNEQESNSGYRGQYNNTNQGRANYNYSQNRSDKGNNNSAFKTVLVIILCILAIPVGLPVVTGIFGLFIGAIITVASLWLAFVIISIVFIIIGVAATIVGIVKFLTVPVIGICFTGGGLILFGFGLLFTMATITLSTKVMPVIIRGFINLCRLPFQNRRVAV